MILRGGGGHRLLELFLKTLFQDLCSTGKKGQLEFPLEDSLRLLELNYLSFFYVLSFQIKIMKVWKKS